MLPPNTAHQRFIDSLQGLRSDSLLKLDFPMNKRGSNSGTESRSTQTDADCKTFLLIDDEQAILTCNSLLLASRGHQIFTAESVTAATQVMEKEADAIDCLIIDFSMPETNGLQLLNQFRSIGWRHPTVLCANLTMSFDDHPNAQYWPEYILAKPYNFHRLQEAISVALRIPD